jgi:hypothetical protein
VSGTDCLCGGSGIIYDYSSKGDPCPECSNGFPAHFSSNIRYRADRAAGRTGRSCAVVLMLALAVAGSLGGLAAHYYL